MSTVHHKHIYEQIYRRNRNGTLLGIVGLLALLMMLIIIPALLLR